jgi:TatD DNase family protein
MNSFCDSHAHIDFETFDEDRGDLIKRAKAAGLEFIINIGINLEGSSNSFYLPQQYPGYVFLAVGIHPNDSMDYEPSMLKRIAELASRPEVVAIGEIGLDFYRDYATPQQQKIALEGQLNLAQSLEKPIVIHERNSAHELVPILLDWYQNLPADSKLKNNPGVMHSFSADLSYVKSLLECNFCFGIGGPITYPNAADKRALVNMLPMENILLETDCPFLAPQKQRGKRNEPAFIPLIAEKIAELRQVSVDEIGQQLTSNARRLFGLY